jgi:RimJ/RimL family protein N-acetyltransferase
VPARVPPAVPAGRLRERPQPSLTVEELVLRPWQASDADGLVAAYADPEISRWHVRSMTRAEAERWLRSWSERWAAETGAGWAITVAEALVGRVGLRTLDLASGLGEAAYWVLPAARGRGVASRALATVTDWAFDDVGLQRVELEHSIANPVSCRVAHRAGFVLEGTKRGQGLHADGWHDMHLHARLRGDAAA